MGSGEWCTPENRKKGNKNKTAAGENCVQFYFFLLFYIYIYIKVGLLRIPTLVR
jgi:hypothetical protein